MLEREEKPSLPVGCREENRELGAEKGEGVGGGEGGVRRPEERIELS